METVNAAAALSFADGLGEFGTFISDGVIAGWTAVLGVMLDSANWLMRLPTYAYLCVVAMSSLRSLIKG